MILTNELSTLDSEIAQLQSLIEAKRQQQEVLTSAENLASEALSRLTQALFKIEEIAPSAIASLKSAVLGLFDNGDNGTGDDGGNQPTDPTPDSDPTPDEPELLCLNGITGDCLTTADLSGEWEPERDAPLADDHILQSENPLIGQTCTINPDLYWAMTTAPDGSAWEFASPLACLLWEDAPLLGQACVIETTPYVELVKVCDALFYQRKHDGEIICAYFGFRTKALAQSWLHFFEAITSKVELRQAKRLEHKWEIKVKGLSIKQIDRYVKECDFSKSYRTEVASSKPPSYKKPEIPQPVNPDEVGEGDIVTALLTPSASYKIIQIMPNGILDCENLTTGDRLGLRPTAVTLVQKAAESEPEHFETTGAYKGLAKQVQQHWEKAGVDPSELIAQMKAKRPPEPAWDAAKYNPVLAAIGDDLDF